MARTNAAAVQGILLKDYDEENAPSLDPFIATATVVVDRVDDRATDNGLTLTSTELELIERWLAAHFYAVSDKPYQSKSTEGASASFAGQTRMYFAATLYGQMAISIDRSGTLFAMGSESGRKSARAVWLGKAPSEQIDYIDRD